MKSSLLLIIGLCIMVSSGASEERYSGTQVNLADVTAEITDGNDDCQPEEKQQGDPPELDSSGAPTTERGTDWILPDKPMSPPSIDFWYGERQICGKLGDSQPLFNVLGSIEPHALVADIWYQVNQGKWQQLMIGPDLHRLARPGDFNIEIDRGKLKAGENIVRVRYYDLWGRKVVGETSIVRETGRSWPLPYEVDFSQVEDLQPVVDVIDGKWVLTEDGVRTAEPYYDRQLGFGDSSWKDMELEAEILFHRHFVDFEDRGKTGPPYLSHAHTSFNLRWAGHPDDGAIPRRAWQNLGSLVALRCDLAQPKAGSYWWMHYGFGLKGKPAPRSEMLKENRFPIDLGHRYHYRMRAETEENGDTRYSTKLWRAGADEPTDWQMVGVDRSETVPNGSILFVVHHSDVTLCRIRVVELP